MSTAAPGTRFKGADLGFLLMLSIGLYVAIVKPWVPELTAQGHLVLFALIITVGMWIFKPLDMPNGISGCSF